MKYSDGTVVIVILRGLFHVVLVGLSDVCVCVMSIRDHPKEQEDAKIAAKECAWQQFEPGALETEEGLDACCSVTTCSRLFSLTHPNGPRL